MAEPGMGRMKMLDDLAARQTFDLDLRDEEWTEFAIAQGWSDGLPLVIPTEKAVERFLSVAGEVREPWAPISPRQVLPTPESLAANAVMAGCRPSDFPVVLAALRAVLQPDFNLHGMLATTHPCGIVIIVSGPIRTRLGIACGSNCFGQGWRANLTIGRALNLILRNIGGARPGEMDNATQGTPAKITFCFGENEEQSPWEPYGVRRGFARDTSLVSCMASEGPHNINDHGSNSAEGIVKMLAEAISQPGTNTIYAKGPFAVVLGPEHAATLHRDGWSVEMIQQALYQGARVHISRIGADNRRHYEQNVQHFPVDDHYTMAPSPADIHVLVAGGAGKHSAWVPSFGYTQMCSAAIDP